MRKNSEDRARHVLKVGLPLTAARHAQRVPLVGSDKHKALIAKNARMGGIQKSQKKPLANRAMRLHCLKTHEPNA